MRTTATWRVGFLGPYRCGLQPGQTQQLVVSATYTGRVWMLHEHRILNHLDQMNGNPTIHQQNKAKLIVDLQGQSKCVIFRTKWE